MTDSDPPVDLVGYKRPPKATRFESGRSGNPKGRPKGGKNFATVIESELNTRVPITENGRRRTISKRQVIAKQLVNKAAAGEMKALPVLLSEIRAIEDQPREGGHWKPTPEDSLVMAAIVRRIQQSDLESNVETPEAAEDPKVKEKIDEANGR